MPGQAAGDPAWIEQRLPVWCAFADLFLDTSYDPPFYDEIAKVMVASGLGLATLETIFRTEVAPAFAVNLLSVAGEWAGWHPDYVAERVQECLGSRRSALAALSLRGYVNAEWAKLMAAWQRAVQA
ncbi:MAG: hypothetical protein H7241_00365 [Novosphingobium sp.]|nr:hypothetical protein [Novosphingobium sp.]